MSDRSYVILTHGINDFERGQAHQIVKSNTDRWWHQFPDVWIVTGHTLGFWRDRMREVIPVEGRGAVLVLEAGVGWSAFGTRAQFDWLQEMWGGAFTPVTSDQSELSAASHKPPLPKAPPAKKS